MLHSLGSHKPNTIDTHMAMTDQETVLYLCVVFCHCLARLSHCSVQLVVSLTHKHSQLPELSQQSVVILGQLFDLIASVLQLCPEDGALLVCALQAVMKLLHLQGGRTLSNLFS